MGGCNLTSINFINQTTVIILTNFICSLTSDLNNRCEDDMKVLILGSGANGMLAGAALTENSIDPAFLVRPERQRQLIVQGTKISSPFGRFTKHVNVVASPADLREPFEVVVIAARANVYQMALFLVRDAIGPETLLVPLMDGAHHLDLWRERYPKNPVALARFETRGIIDADGVVRQTAPKGLLELGPIQGASAERVAALAIALSGRRFEVATNVDTLLARIWARHIFLAAAAGATRLSGVPSLRDTLRFNSTQSFEAMLKEGTAAGVGHGVPKLFEAVQRYRQGFLQESSPIMAPCQRHFESDPGLSDVATWN
jgi:2-dehydropantoate 2-reductase